MASPRVVVSPRGLPTRQPIQARNFTDIFFHGTVPTPALQIMGYRITDLDDSTCLQYTCCLEWMSNRCPFRDERSTLGAETVQGALHKPDMTR